jgi:hypothetical protein
MNKKFKKIITKNLNNSNEMIMKIFKYLKGLETTLNDKKIQKIIYYVCEIEELNNEILITMECDENE